MLAYTIVFKESKEDPLWDNIVYLRDEYPSLSFADFEQMCEETARKLATTNEIVYGCVEKLTKVK